MAVRLSDRDLVVLDERRKGQNRSAYLRSLLLHVERPSLGARSSLSEPEPTDPVQPIPEPEPLPVPAPIVPPVPPPTPVETGVPLTGPSTRTEERHLHRYKKVTGQEPSRWVGGVAFYRYRCECGETKEDR